MVKYIASGTALVFGVFVIASLGQGRGQATKPSWHLVKVVTQQRNLTDKMDFNTIASYKKLDKTINDFSEEDLKTHLAGGYEPFSTTSVFVPNGDGSERDAGVNGKTVTTIWLKRLD